MRADKRNPLLLLLEYFRRDGQSVWFEGRRYRAGGRSRMR